MYAAAEGYVWRQSQAIQAQAMGSTLMPGLGGNSLHVKDVSQWLRGGIRSERDGSDRTKLRAIQQLEDGLMNDLHAPAVELVGDED